MGVTDAIYLDNLIFKLQVQVECAIARERVKKGRRTGQRPWVNTYCHAQAATAAQPLLPSLLLPETLSHCCALPGIQLDNQTHKQKAPKNRKERTKQKAAQWRYCAAYGAKGEWGAWQRHWWDEVSIFSQVSSADFHFHRMQLNASFAPLFFLFFFLCLLSVAATKVSQTTLKCIYKCKNERGAAAQRRAARSLLDV